MKYLHRCTRGHLVDNLWKTSRDVQHLRCTVAVIRMRDMLPMYGPCGCRYRPVRTRALLAAYRIGGLEAALEMDATVPARKRP